MSNISTAIDAIRDAVKALFPDRNELANPYSLEDNINKFLDIGFGITVTSTNESETDYLNYSNVAYTVNVILTQAIVKKESDPDIYYSGLKSILEDEKELRVDFLNSDKLSVAETVINKIDYAGTSGIEKIVDKNKHISITVSFEIDISEAI